LPEEKRLVMDHAASRQSGPFASLRLVALLAAASSTVWLASAGADTPRPEPAAPINRAEPVAVAEANLQEEPNGGRPQPAGNETARQAEAQDENGEANANANGAVVPTSTRRPTDNVKVPFTFKDAPIEETFAWIAETTGKVVMPLNLAQLRTKRITVINDEPIDKQTALDLLFQAFRLSQVAVFEKPDVIIIDVLTNLPANIPPVIPDTEDIMERRERGAIVIKIFQIKKTAASMIGDQISNTMLPDYATISVDENSNRIVVMGDIGLCQEIQNLIDQLDVPPVDTKTETFYLKYIAADTVYNNILDLYEEGSLTSLSAGTGGAQRNLRGAAAARQAAQQGRQTTMTASGVRPTADLRVTTVPQHNAVSVAGEVSVVEAIGKLIRDDWDLPLRPEVTKVYELKFTDPIKVRDLLQSILEQGGTSSAARTAGGQQRPGFNQAGGQGGATQSVEGIFRIEAYADSNNLIVVAKTREAFPFLDAMIEAIDQPINPGGTILIPLKHAEAEQVADLLNVLLAEAGANLTLQRAATGLTQSVGSEIGGQAGGVGAGGTGGNGTATAPTDMRFPWQSGRQRDDQAEVSPLVGKVRIVPMARNNSIMILAPNEYREAVRSLVVQLDQPSRQVMISAVVAEIQLTDALALGLRFSNSDAIFNTARPDASVGGNISGSGGLENFTSLFNTSVLDANISVNILVQALKQQNRIRVLQQPRVFTSENQEAQFFQGQDIPFITDSNITDIGGVTQSFDYLPVGVRLDVRPRITVEGHVEMEINLELSSIVPGETLFGGFIIDRRETISRITVKNGQTIVLSGILTDRESVITRKIPLLGDIPFLGEFFTSRDNETTTTELVAFITPSVVNHPDENDFNFNVEDRESLRDYSLPIKKHHPDPPIQDVIDKLDADKSALENVQPVEPDDVDE
jgi:type II secretion system protein D